MGCTYNITQLSMKSKLLSLCTYLTYLCTMLHMCQLILTADVLQDAADSVAQAASLARLNKTLTRTARSCQSRYVKLVDSILHFLVAQVPL